MKLAIVTSSGSQQTDLAVRTLLSAGFSVLERPLSVRIAQVVKEFSPHIVYIFWDEFGEREADIALRIREQDHSIAIALVSDEVDNSSKQIALSAGIDLIMPNDAGVFAAHVKAIARRLEREAAGVDVEPEEQSVIEVGNVRLDKRIYTAFCNNVRIPLTPMEFRMLWALMSELDTVVSPAEVIQRATGYDASPKEASDSLKVYVRRIRVKLGAAGANVHILTVRGFGYMVSSLPDLGDAAGFHRSGEREPSRLRREG